MRLGHSAYAQTAVKRELTRKKHETRSKLNGTYFVEIEAPKLQEIAVQAQWYVTDSQLNLHKCNQSMLKCPPVKPRKNRSAVVDSPPQASRANVPDLVFSR